MTQIIGGDTTPVDAGTVDSSSLHTYPCEITDTSGNVFTYLQGATSTAAGSWVTYDSTGATTLLAPNAIGRVAIAMAAVNANTKYGWYQVIGVNTIALSDTTAANKPLYIDASAAGKVDDAVVAGDLVLNAFSTASDTAGVLPVWINRPIVTDTLS